MLDYSKRKCYGFMKNKSEEFIINETEASNVKLIFECFLNGMSLSEIAKELHAQGIASPSGKEVWNRKVISSTLSNEKYSLYGIISTSDFESVQLGKLKRNTTSASAELTESNEEKSPVIAENTAVEICDSIEFFVVKALGLVYNRYVNLFLNVKKHIVMILYTSAQERIQSILLHRFISSA